MTASPHAANRGYLDRRFAAAKGVADTICYEGYVLYPYRASARKNQLRWQFGVLAPPSATAGGSERSSAQAEIVVEGRGARLHVRLRALQVQQRAVEARRGEDFVPVATLDTGGRVWTSFDEAVEYQADMEGVDLEVAATSEVGLAVDLPGDHHEEAILAPDGTVEGRVVRRRWPVTGRSRVSATPIDGPYALTRVTIAVDNDTDWSEPGAGRDAVMRRSLVAAHLLVAVDGGRVISSLDPPRFAAAAVAGCTNTGLFPVLVGDDGAEDVVLASPIILYDYPAIAPESEGDMFDATEIDEILALRVLTLTDEEKREARGTDPRSAAIIDRCDAMDADALDALHGTLRSLRSLGSQAPGNRGFGTQEPAWQRFGDEAPGSQRFGDQAPGSQRFGDEAPWWEPQEDGKFDPWSDTVKIGGATVGAGTHVRLRPQRRSDAQDLFIDGRTATVAGVFNDVSGDVYLAVAVDGPDADLHQWHGRYLYFHPDEVELLAEGDPIPPGDAGVAGTPPDGPRVLVAGVGNIFLGDDGFGVEVARHLDAAAAPAGVKVVDFGIRGVHLAYELLEGYDTLILVDAVSRGDEPGTVSVIEHIAGGDSEGGTLEAMDAHGMDPGAVLAMAGDLGANVGRVLVVGCETADVGDGIGLSEPVAEAVPHAVAAVHELLASITGVAGSAPDALPQEVTP